MATLEVNSTEFNKLLWPETSKRERRTGIFWGYNDLAETLHVVHQCCPWQWSPHGEPSTSLGSLAKVNIDYSRNVDTMIPICRHSYLDIYSLNCLLWADQKAVKTLKPIGPWTETHIFFFCLYSIPLRTLTSLNLWRGLFWNCYFRNVVVWRYHPLQSWRTCLFISLHSTSGYSAFGKRK